jgi:hypothetical protein
MLTEDGHLTARQADITGVINATSGHFTGEVNATSGYFDGTVYAKHIEGDVIASGLLPVSSYNNRQNGQSGAYFESTVHYRGGSEYAMMVSVPFVTMFIDYANNGEASGGGVVYGGVKIELFINNTLIASQTYNKPAVQTSISISGASVIPAGIADIPITVRCTMVGVPGYVDFHIPSAPVFVNFLGQGNRFY